ncbi:hypothetical protein [Aurantiacibacter sediminis]|uniref:Secreted protein n=1 Tax=Aurantiacibacter sediminis TaxID=2793064 RepID=A0ABS0N4G6_9SPHN|nr:hypothetical protein [Aurantiacibacter sediminis]MBH5322225.1 hypothetical protein [Aurantiacibacter sediminis]
MLRVIGSAALFAAALTGCDAASEIAGDALDNEIRSQIANQCQAVAEGAGVVADRLTEVCDCTAQTYIDDPDLTADDITPARIEEIVNECTQQTGDMNDAPAEETPAEETGA